MQIMPPPLGVLRAAAWNSSCHLDYVLFVGWLSSALTARVVKCISIDFGSRPGAPPGKGEGFVCTPGSKWIWCLR
ncbi:Hypothetical predicted protein [Podarcis lilfordi]|uniref:Uncharacterized protein n=1 Tax=Podarcis lilfordi TaxID=74358 RepID=A0AA35KYF6_9SAUR|nr:Hypothetical predicted protein [Podarcis lilfordi]